MDKERAVSILESVGLPEAAYLLGKCYFIGEVVSEDKDKAIQLFAKAANDGYAPAQYALAKCYEKGDGVPKDIDEAKKWYGIASGNDSAEADEALMRLGIWH